VVHRISICHIEELNTERPTFACLHFGFYENRMDRQTRIGDRVLIKSREISGIGANHYRGGSGSRGKDDRKQNTLVRLITGGA